LTDSQNDAKKYALKLLAYRGRSESELRERLARKGFAGEAISRTLDYLKRAGYLDDHLLAETLKRRALEEKRLGFQGAKDFMVRRGLPPHVVESTLDYDEDRELRNAEILVDKKLGSMGNYVRKSDKRRLWYFLARRGFSSGIIRKTLKDLHHNEEDEE
jgi:regulatory protein